jgi:hypothetical protein
LIIDPIVNPGSLIVTYESDDNRLDGQLSFSPDLPRTRVYNMLRQLLIGGGASVCNITIHAWVMMAIVSVVHLLRPEKEGKVLHPLMLLVGIMIAVVCVLMGAHVVEVAIWALIYGLVDAAPPGADLLYFAFVNYTTLGYGDVVPLLGRQLLGPMTAMNGVLLFGWSTAVIFEVLRRTMMLCFERVGSK